MSEWKKYRLREFAERITSGGTPSTRKTEYFGGNIPWLRTQEVNFNRIYETEIKITEKAVNNSSAKFIKANSIIVAMYGATAGRIAINKIPLTTNQACCNITIDKNKADYNYVYYYLKSKFEEILKLATGAAQQNLNAGMLRELEILAPDLPTQTQIASILTTFDDKIELLGQMNQTLETMAQTIFKEWCCTKEDITPKNWTWKKLNDIADVSSSKRIFREEYTTNGIPFYRGKEITQLSNGESISTELYISNERYFEIKEKFGIPKIGDILVTSVGTIGSVWLVDNELPFYFKDGNVTWIKDYKTEANGAFVYQWVQSKETKEQIKSVTIGSTQQALTISALKDLDILIPDRETVHKVCVQLENINAKKISNLTQIHTLTQLRDTLLPKLMSGKIKIIC